MEFYQPPPQLWRPPPPTHTTPPNFNAFLWKDGLYGKYTLHIAVWQALDAKNSFKKS